METQRVTAQTRDFLEAERAAPEDDYQDDGGGLTDAGWPRERVDGWPIPWISPRRQLSQTDESRLQACASGAVCAVCGLGYQADETALAITRPPDNMNLQPGDVVTPAEGAEFGITPIDNGVLHRHCARLALIYCPKLNELLEDDELIVLEVVAHTAVPQFLDLDRADGKRMWTATFDEGTVVEIPL